jgi:hypothetical protein
MWAEKFPGFLESSAALRYVSSMSAQQVDRLKFFAEHSSDKFNKFVDAARKITNLKFDLAICPELTVSLIDAELQFENIYAAILPELVVDDTPPEMMAIMKDMCWSLGY